jgi:hypothetical protein
MQRGREQPMDSVYGHWTFATGFKQLGSGLQMPSPWPCGKQLLINCPRDFVKPSRFLLGFDSVLP